MGGTGGWGGGGEYYFDHGGPVERYTPLAARLRKVNAARPCIVNST
jgi:hypothetical protein